MPNKRSRNVRMSMITISDTTLLEKYSDLFKLIRVVGYCRRCKGDVLKEKKNQEASRALCRMAEANAFQEEINKLSKGKSVNLKSTIIQLDPFLDEERILRVGGRLENANISFLSKHPINLGTYTMIS
jgi:hypothetical protein